MKFASLALVTLLALGCQAASLQADAAYEVPPYVQTFRDTLTTMVKTFQSKGLSLADRVEDPEMKAMVSSKVQELVDRVQALRETAQPMTDGFLKTMTEATADLRNNLQNEMDALQKDLEPKREALRAVVNKHLDEYRAALEPMFREMQSMQMQNAAQLRANYEPVLTDLSSKVSTNVEETKTALMPILDQLNAKFWEQFTVLKDMVNPYVEEYKDQARAAYANAQGFDHAAALNKARPHMEAMKVCLDEFVAKMKTVMDQ